MIDWPTWIAAAGNPDCQGSGSAGSGGASSWLWNIVAGVVGATLAFALSAYREYRRSAETYRNPQRQAIADIAGATDELQISVGMSIDEVAASINSGRWTTQPQWALGDYDIGVAIDGARRAAIALARAFDLGRIVLVDEHSRQARDEARDVLTPVLNVLRQPNPNNLVRAELYRDDMRNLIPRLQASVDHLVDVAAPRLGPVVTLGTRLRHVGRRIDA